MIRPSDRRNAVRLVSAAVVLAGILPAAGSALADTTGGAGRIVAYEHNDDSSDAYGSWRGRLFVDEKDGPVQPYFIGGVICPAIDLTVEQQRMLVDAMGQKKTLIVPYWKLGQAAARCLVSFTLVTTPKVLDEVTK